MGFRKPLGAAILAVLPFFVAPAAAQEAAAPPGPAILDEFNLEVFGGSNSARLAGGLTFGNVLSSGLWWNYGARLSWVHYVDGGPVDDGWGLGGTIGLGWNPRLRVSPVAGLSLEKTFGTEVIDYQTQVHVGARIRVTPDPTEYVAMTVAIYQSEHFFGSGLPDASDTGIAILFSTARFAPR